MLYQDRHSRVVLLLTGVLQGRMYVVPDVIRVYPLIFLFLILQGLVLVPYEVIR